MWAVILLLRVELASLMLNCAKLHNFKFITIIIHYVRNTALVPCTQSDNISAIKP